MCKFCGQESDSRGCVPDVRTSKEGGNLFVQVISFGFCGQKQTIVNTTNYHKGPIGYFCEICRKGSDETTCSSDIIKNENKYTENVLTGFKTQYTHDK